MVLIYLILTVWLGTLFVYSAGLKFVRYEKAGSSIRPYAILPRGIDSVIGFILPWVEALTGIFLLINILFPIGPLLAAALGTSFVFASSCVLQRGTQIPCGCTGGTKDRVTRTTLVRAMFITASSLLLLYRDGFEPVPLPLTLIVLLILASLLPSAMAAFWRFRAIQRRQVHVRYLQKELERARYVLSTKPSPPIPDA